MKITSFFKCTGLICTAVLAGILWQGATSHNQFSDWIEHNYKLDKSMAQRIAQLPIMQSVDTITDKQLKKLNVDRRDLPLVKRELVGTIFDAKEIGMGPMLLEPAFRDGSILLSFERPRDQLFEVSGYQHTEIMSRIKSGLFGFVQATNIRVETALNSRARRQAHERVRIVPYRIPNLPQLFKGGKVRRFKFDGGDYRLDDTQGSLEITINKHPKLGAYFPTTLRGIIDVNLYPFKDIYSHLKDKSVNDRLANYAEGLPEAIYHEMLHATCFYGNIGGGKQGHSMNPSSLMTEAMEAGFQRKIANGAALLTSEMSFFRRDGYEYTEKIWKPQNNISAKAVRVLRELYASG